MDLSHYIRKSQTQSGRHSMTKIEKRCLECGKFLDNEGTYLYRQSFCSEKCKMDYIGK